MINQHSDVYGNPYSDASKKVAVALDQPVDGGEVAKLQLTIQPDSGGAQPASGGNPDCGIGAAAPPAALPAALPPAPPAAKHVASKARARFRKRSELVRGGFRLGRVVCPGGCAEVTATAKLGRKAVARGTWRGAASNRVLKMKLTKAGRRLLSGKKGVRKLKIGASAIAADGTRTQLHGRLKLRPATR